ncbi:MAG: copper resistance system multicopper oxidase [Pseudomonadota bacterium]
MPVFRPHKLSRRRFVTGLSGAALCAATSTRANPIGEPRSVLSGNSFRLSLDYLSVNMTGKQRLATVVNGQLPGPLLRWREGDTVTVDVDNRLAEDSSIHWHGIILPTSMDGVPGMSFSGIRPGDHFRYRFQLNQSGTYWYHSHSGYQEQTGLYGAIVIDPKGGDPDGADKDYVVMLSDWTDEDPAAIYARLKKVSHYYNFNERTVADLWRELGREGLVGAWRDRAMWNEMRMSDSDIADVTGYTYTYLMNGTTPDPGWKGLFKPGERIRLRFINGSAMSIFDVRIPGLDMTIVAADGQPVEPVTVEEFRIGTAETYDVLVSPKSEIAYAVFAQSIDRGGYAFGVITPDPSLTAEVPTMDPVPVLTHADMGMGGHTGHAAGEHTGPAHRPNTGIKSGDPGAHHGHHHQGHHQGHSMMADAERPAPAGNGSSALVVHAATEYGPQVDMRAEMPVSGIHDPGIGLRQRADAESPRVLSYDMLRYRYQTADRRDPEREIQLHLTGNMSRYMWSFDGVKFADADPIRLSYGERVRFFLVNDTMMTHPIHLHGLWSELETGDALHLPRKHTVLVQPGKTASYLVTADALGRWAYHCHLQYHMLGMMREVRVT